jgi:hypothetical protein
VVESSDDWCQVVPSHRPLCWGELLFFRQPVTSYLWYRSGKSDPATGLVILEVIFSSCRYVKPTRLVGHRCCRACPDLRPSSSIPSRKAVSPSWNNHAEPHISLTLSSLASRCPFLAVSCPRYWTLSFMNGRPGISIHKASAFRAGRFVGICLISTKHSHASDRYPLTLRSQLTCTSASRGHCATRPAVEREEDLDEASQLRNFPS